MIRIIEDVVKVIENCKKQKEDKGYTYFGHKWKKQEK